MPQSSSLSRPKRWHKILQDLAAQIGPQEVDRWFQEVELLSREAETAVIGVPSRLHLERLRDRHQAALCQALGVDSCRFEIQAFDLDELLAEHQVADVATSPSSSPASPSSASSPGPAAPKLERPLLLPDTTFEEFVVGPCNRFACAAARGVADRPAAAFNPLFLHGSVGLGKTHLMQAIAHQLLQANPQTRIVFLSCEEFVNHFIQALQKGNIHAFRNRYRSADVLVVDDIQLLANKSRTQEEFFHTFNTLHNASKQIVLSSDSPPEEIPDLQERLISRFKWGLVAEIEPPCFETRMAILHRKAERIGFSLPDEVAQFVAERIENNVRELEGMLTRIRALSALTHRPVDLLLAQEAIGNLGKACAKPIRVDDILERICAHFGSTVANLQSKRRTHSIVFPRQVAMFLARRLTDLSLGEIGGFFGGRDHSTVLYALERIESRRRVDGDFSVLLTDLEGQIRDHSSKR